MRGGEHLYVIQMAVTGAFKVGRTCDPQRRLRELQTGAPHPLRIILVAENQGNREITVHKRLRAYRTRRYSGEWFREEGMGELPDDVYERIPVEALEDTDWWKQDP
jgi:hypothetical protein